MKICIVIRRLSLNWGGAERVAVSLLKRLREKGHEVHVITADTDLRLEGITMHLLSISRLFSAGKLLSFQIKASRIIEQNRFDIVYALCQIYPADVYRAGGGVHRYWMEVQYPNTFLRRAKYVTSPVHLVMVYLERQLFKKGNCSLVITNSHLVKKQLIQYHDVPEDRISVLYNGIEHAVFNPHVKEYRNDMRKAFQIKPDDIVLLFVANNWKRKGLQTVIKAIPKTDIHNLKLVIVGRGKKAPFLSLAQRLGLEQDTVIFAGFQKNIDRFYGMSDISVLPSRYEPFANVCLEAMACGIPVITTRLNGASEIIAPGKNGFILDDWQDADELARCIKELCHGRKHIEMGKNAVSIAQNYTWERHVDNTEVFFNALKA